MQITSKDRWEQAVAEGEYRSDTLATEGSIHCCLPGQLSGVVSRYFQGQTELVVLRIDPNKLKPPLRWECSPGSVEVFPHVYGSINLDALVGVVKLEEVLGR